jgi:F-type H+-transporting ATPase subunit b
VLIDWFTVAAQALNFLVLVWLLKRFLYQPVLDAISTREQRIAKQLADAAAQAAAAKSEREQFEHKNAEFDGQRAALLEAAGVQAKAEGARLLEQARQQADGLRSRLKDSWRDEQQLLGAEISRRTRDEVFAIARKTLADLASVGLEQSMTQVFVDRLAALGDSERALLAAATAATAAAAATAAPVTAPDGALTVRTAFELQPPERSAIEEAVTKICGTAVHLSYQTVPGLVSGIELCASGHKLAWSISDYLGALEKNAGETLASATAAATPPAPKPVAAPAPAAAVAPVIAVPAASAVPAVSVAPAAAG